MKNGRKKDKGSIFNPVMYLMIMLLSVQLLFLFLGYKQMMGVSEAVTDTMTDALLGAGTMNEAELYAFGTTDQLEITNPEEKYNTFKSILIQELKLTNDMRITNDSLPKLEDKVTIKDFRIYSVNGRDITVYDFDENGNYTMSYLRNGTGSLRIDDGTVIHNSTMLARIGMKVNFLGVSIDVPKYHMIDLKKF